jgi:hypothetical protein
MQPFIVGRRLAAVKLAAGRPLPLLQVTRWCSFGAADICPMVADVPILYLALPADDRIDFLKQVLGRRIGDSGHCGET